MRPQTHWLAIGLCAGLALLSTPGSVEAQWGRLTASTSAGRDGSSEDDFWATLAEPSLADYRLHLERGKQDLEEALARPKRLRGALLRGAIMSLNRATELRPKRWEAHYWRGVALDHIERTDEAIESLNRARALGAEDLADDIAFRLGVAFTKLGRFDEAVAAYERSLTYAFEDGMRAVIESNCAETLMALGRLGEAIRRYRKAAELTRDQPLVYWGLGVALDRDDQSSRAREAITRALALDPNMLSLIQPNVFFVPAGEVHYYLALGAEVKGSRDEAVRGWKRFLDLLPKSPWAPRARQHLEELKRQPLVVPRTLDAQVVRLSGALSARELGGVTTVEKPGLSACLSQAPRGKVSVRLRLAIGASGEVGRVSPVRARGAGTVISCLEHGIRRWRFPPASRETLAEMDVTISR